MFKKLHIKRDITIRFIPNILSNEGRIIQSLPYDRRWTIRRYLKKSKVNFEDMRIIVNGNEIKRLRQHLQNGDEIVVVPNIEIPAIGAVIAKAWAFSLAHPFLAAMRVAMVLSTAYSIYSALTTKTKTPSFDTIGDGLDEGSPSASWTGAKTVRDPNGSVPVIYGRYLTGGTVINEYISTDGEKNYLNSLVAIGEGPMKSVTLLRINKNAAANFSNYTIETRLGTNDQEPISGFEDLHDIHSLSVKLEKDDPYVYTTQISDLEAFEIILNLPNGLYQQDSMGNISSWAATYKVEYKLHSAGEWTDLGSTTISAKTNTVIQKIFRKDGLTAGQYDIRITKTSEDPSDLSSPITIGDLYLTGVDEINTDDLAYPNTTVTGVKAIAVDELSGDEPNYEFLAEAKLVLAPKVMNGAEQVDWEDIYWDPDTEQYKLLSDGTVLTWDGTTYVEQFCANPIWCLYDLMTNTRYGLGDYITTGDHDLDFLLEMSRYCDEKVPDGEGGYEKRFRMDICIDSPQNALNLIMQLASIFNGLPFYSDNGKIRIAIDKPDASVQLFNMGNIIKDSFSQTWGSKRDVPNIVQVQFNNQDNYYETDMISVIDEESLAAGDPKRIKQIRFYGTKLSYAIRFGRFVIKAAKHINRTISIKAGIAALIRQCSEVIDLAHDVPQWGFSGCVQADSTTTKVKLDQEITIESGKSYAIRVDFAQLNEDGTPRYEERTVTDAPGTYTEVNVSSAFSVAPAKNDAYSFGELNKLVLPARIVSLKRQRNGEVEIEAQEYNEDVYDDTAVVIPAKKTSSLSLEIPDVENLKLTEGLSTAPDGTTTNIIYVWFTRPNTTGYKVRRLQKVKIYLSDNDGDSWEYIGETYSDSFMIERVLKDGVKYTVAAVSVSNDNETKAVSTSPQDSITLVGDTLVPGDVATFLINQSRDRLYFGWSSVADARVLDYEIRYGDNWDAGYVIVTKRGTDHIELNFRIGVEQKFFIKAKTRSGRYSQNATEALLTVENIPFTNIITSFSEQTGWAGDKSNTTKVGDNLEISEGELSGTYETPVRDVGYVATFKIGIESVVVNASSDERMNDSETERMNDSETERMSGEEAAGAASFRIKTSEDNVTWSDYRDYQAGDYKCRYFQLEMTLTRSDPSKDIQCSQFNYYSDLPDVDEVQDGEVTVAADGCEITFAKTFHEDPAINITILTGTGIYWKASSLSTTGVIIKLYDISGDAVTGTFRIHIHGV